MGSIQVLTNSSEKIYALTAAGSLHTFEGQKASLHTQTCFMTSVTSRIKKIVFPHNFSAVFACLCDRLIYIYRVEDQKELLTIKIENDASQSVSANCIEFMPDGRSILTGWTDGKVRSFTPQSGKLLFIMKDVHSARPHEAS